MRKYAVDLTGEDVIIDPHTNREIIIDLLDSLPRHDKVLIVGHYDDNGDPYDRTLDYDSQVKVKS